MQINFRDFTGATAISHDASVIVLTRHGYETAVEGKTAGHGPAQLTWTLRTLEGNPRPGCVDRT